MSEKRVSYEEALKMAQEHSIQALEAVLIDREATIARLQQENERLRRECIQWQELVQMREMEGDV